MSDLYLVLHSRLEPVGKRFEWVDLGPEVMLEARKRTGLSREAVSRKLNVSTKTYERYEKMGQVPRHELRSVAEVLELEIEDAEPTRLGVRLPSEDDRLAALEERAGRTEARLGEVQATVQEIRDLLRSRRTAR